MIGQTISHYRITERLGAGGMGVVYKAEDTTLCRPVALKFLPEDLQRDEDALKRFLREAKSAAAIEHPFICNIKEVGQSEDGLDFIAMEYVEGQTLQDRLGGGPLPYQEGLRIACEVAEALEFAHEKGIVHRDLKPSNIMLTRSGHAKVMDFGLAKKIATHEGTEQEISSALTRDASVLGTLSYMSPEQLRAETVDHRSDIFSFGIVLYEMLSGVHPFRKPEPMATAGAILNQEPPPVARFCHEASELLQYLLEKMLAKGLSRRYQLFHDVRTDLGKLLEDSDRLPQGVAVHRKRGLPWRWILAGGVTLPAIVVAWWSLTGIDLRVWDDSTAQQVPVEPIKITPFTFDGGQKLFPRLSPSGRAVAFEWLREGNGSDIYIKQIGTNTDVIQRTDSPGEDCGVVWSPDGETLAFVRVAPGAPTAVYTIPWLGGQQEKLVEIDGQPWSLEHTFQNGLSWSPDGKRLAYGEKPTGEPGRIVLLDLETREKKILTEPPAESLGDLHPSFSPNGRQIAFVRSPSSQYNQDIWLKDLESGEARQLTSEHYSRCESLNWTEDGEELVFSAGAFGEVRIYRVELDTGLTHPVSGLGTSESQPSLAAGRLVAVRSTGGEPMNVWAAPARVSDRRAPPRPLIRSRGFDANMRFSPDGKKIAFSSSRIGQWQIWIADSDGSNPFQLTDMPAEAFTPSWSPDGRLVSFTANSGKAMDVYVMDLESRRVRQLTNQDANDSEASFSRDGRWIYFSSDRSGNGQIWKIPAEGGEAIQITREGGAYGVESFDGRFLYYAKSYPKGSIWRVPSQGGEEVEVVSSSMLWGEWDLAGRGLYYPEVAAGDSPYTKTYRIQYLDLETGEIEEIFSEEGPYSHMWLAVSPDESVVLFSRWEARESELVLVENFR